MKILLVMLIFLQEGACGSQVGLLDLSDAITPGLSYY